MNKLQLVMRSVGQTMQRESPSILTAAGVTGFLTTVIMAVAATPKAMRRIDEESYSRSGGIFDDSPSPDISPKEIIGLVWDLYLPATIVGLTSIACIVGSDKISLQRNAALMSLYSLTDRALKEYQEKVAETIGEKKEQVIRDNIAQDRLNADPIEGAKVVLTGIGDHLMYDSFSGRYFRSDIETIRQAVNEFNRNLLSEMYATLNEFYSDLGLEGIDLGNSSGWTVERGLLEVDFSAMLATNKAPCIVMTLKPLPRPL